MVSFCAKALAAIMLVAVAGRQTLASPAPEPSFVPWPKALKMDSGSLAITGNTRIVAESKELEPLAKILSDEIRLVTGLRLAADIGKAGKGDIGLMLDASLAKEAHQVVVGDCALVSGGNYVGVGMGTAAVLQSLQGTDGKVSLPRMTLRDQPYPEYTGMMLDIARQFNSIETLKQCVVLARLYKMKYFHLHMTDDQIFTFPSTKYAARLKGVYTLAELKDLVRFADERGVTIIPEFEMPGHSSQLSVAFTDVFCDSQGCVINFLNPGAMPILTDLVNEMCDVFQSSPYFHMGSDECNWDLFEKWPNVVEDRKINKRGTSQQHGWLINEINKVVKKRGKSLIVWEGFDGPDAGVDKDVIVMEWDGRFFPPHDVAAAGYKMISVPWVPAIWATARECYEWNMWLLGSQDRTPDQFKRGTPEADLVMGGMMQLWECGGDSALPQLRSTAVPRHERIHSPDAGKTYEDFDRRFRSTDQILDLLVHKFVVRTDGLVNYGDTVFNKSLVLTVEPSPSLRNAVFRYTLENALDGKMPSYPGDGKKPGPDSPVYTAPIRITESTQFNVQAFDANGKELGFPRLTKYMLRPLSGTMKGLLPQERYRQNRYSDPVSVTLQSAVGGEIRYTTDGSDVGPANGMIYDGPIKIEKGAKTVRAAVFLNGKKQGEEWSEDFIWVNFEKNMTTGKRAAWGRGMPQATPTPASEFQPGNAALDGFADKDNHWATSPFPAWLKVDLGETATIDRISLYCWWGDDRRYQYTIELSEDDKTWKRIVDASRNTEKTTDQGYRHKFSPTPARYIRVTMLRNSANIAVHICELRAYETR
jgi:hexosaminidase